MKNFKKVGLVFVSILAVISLGACSAEWKTSDAVDYVKTSLNAFTKGDMKKYAEITKQTEKEAKSEYEDGINEILKSFEGPGVTDSAKAELKTVMLDLLKISKYDVKSAEKIKDGFDVKLTVKPFIGFDNLESELKKQVTPEAIEKSGVDVTNETAVNEWAMGITIDFMKQAVKNPTYGTEKEMTVKVKGTSNNYQLIHL
ncbi:hypothetical protein [Pseudolactococcus laudensis]|uniref:hypothetical protein n=1 Tax=Pseudolactococcus laudensis TaxID=1494461 RepID=UPI00027753CE|nr:hypothetical protein BN193_08615 [Lactococcus raffinolactis 4877]